jgi:hypothetical protein
MSEEIFSVATPFPDVASLAQGYMNRADGERLLLPLPLANASGTGVRFVVYLSDGTPAFAGAGLCSQASDQGDTVPSEQRYETLLDTLNFDERSRPVYDYIVAVRNAAYAQQQEEQYAEAVVSDEVPVGEVGEEVQAFGGDDEPTVFQRVGQRAPSTQPPPISAPPPDPSVAPPAPEPEVADAIAIESMPAQAALADAAALMRQQSFVPPPIPTGLLTRPARAMHWQPAPPRRPTPRPSTGLFRYGTGGLPRPAGVPRPEIDPAVRVQPAPRP